MRSQLGPVVTPSGGQRFRGGSRLETQGRARSSSAPRSPSVQMTDRNGEGVGGVVRRRRRVEAEQQADHALDLVLVGAAVADDGALDLGRRIRGYRHAGARGGDERDAARWPSISALRTLRA